MDRSGPPPEPDGPVAADAGGPEPPAAAPDRDLLLALSTAGASWPVIGRYLRSAGAATAIGMWGYRHLPGLAVASLRAMSPAAVYSRSVAIRAADGVYRRLLPATGAGGDPAVRPARRVPLGPVTSAALHHRYTVQAGIRYGPDPAQSLDVWRRRDLPVTARAPVLVYLPAGGWVYGSRRLQAHHMLAHLADQGWVCVAADYRVAPHHPWPAHIQDVKRVIAWVRGSVAGYGGDPGFLALSGCSAGGHLAALAGLTANDPAFQPGFERADTSVDAVVSIYGRYDWEDRAGRERAEFMSFLERVVVGRRQVEAPDLFRAASPLARVHPEAPPFLVIHGTRDTIIPVEQARVFATALRSVSRAPVVYAELPGAQHAFDMIDNERTARTAEAVERFLLGVRAGPRRVAGQPG